MHTGKICAHIWAMRKMSVFGEYETVIGDLN